MIPKSLFRAGVPSSRAVYRSLGWRSLSSCPALYSQSSSNKINVEELLATPSWSAASLLPFDQTASSTPGITPKQLHHLLRLSALPPPRDQEEEDKMLSTLSSQLHFVKDIQQVDTTGVEPLRSLRDETAQGEKEAELGMDALKEALDREEIRGKHHKRIRRRQDLLPEKREEKWDVMGSAARKAGRYFVVEGGKDRRD